jgi:hypothetical protein
MPGRQHRNESCASTFRKHRKRHASHDRPDRADARTRSRESSAGRSVHAGTPRRTVAGGCCPSTGQRVSTATARPSKDHLRAVSKSRFFTGTGWLRRARMKRLFGGLPAAAPALSVVQSRCRLTPAVGTETRSACRHPLWHFATNCRASSASRNNSRPAQRGMQRRWITERLPYERSQAWPHEAPEHIGACDAHSTHRLLGTEF